MSNFYTVVAAQQTTRVLSQTQSVPVEAVGIYTKPSNVYLTVQVPLDAYKSGKGNKYLEPPALLVEQLMGNDITASGAGSVATHVLGAQQVQATDSSGLLAYFVDFTVYYLPDTHVGAPLTGTVRIPMTSLESFAAFEKPIQGGTPSDLIQHEYDRLVKLAGS